MTDYPPVTLIVEDDYAMASVISESFLSNTQMGVLVATSLPDAQRFVSNRNYRFNAIVSDLFVESRKMDHQHELYDGVDVIEYAQKHRRGIPSYVMSVYSGDARYHQKADQLGLSIRGWFDKFKLGETRPWTQVEKQLIVESLSHGAGMAQKSTDEEAENLAESIKGLRPSMRFTYHQFENPEHKLKTTKPIETVCYQEGENWTADAFKIGLILTGKGDSIVSALGDLGNIVCEEFMNLEAAKSKQGLVGYADHVYEGLAAHLARYEPENHPVK